MGSEAFLFGLYWHQSSYLNAVVPWLIRLLADCALFRFSKTLLLVHLTMTVLPSAFCDRCPGFDVHGKISSPPRFLNVAAEIQSFCRVLKASDSPDIFRI